MVDPMILSASGVAFHLSYRHLNSVGKNSGFGIFSMSSSQIVIESLIIQTSIASQYVKLHSGATVILPADKFLFPVSKATMDFQTTQGGVGAYDNQGVTGNLFNGAVASLAVKAEYRTGSASYDELQLVNGAPWILPPSHAAILFVNSQNVGFNLRIDYRLYE